MIAARIFTAQLSRAKIADRSVVDPGISSPYSRVVRLCGRAARYVNGMPASLGLKHVRV